MPFDISPEGVSISIQGRMLRVNGFVVRRFELPGHALIRTALKGDDLHIHYRRPGGAVRHVKLDLYEVGIEPEVDICIDLSEQEMAFPPQRRAA